MAMETVNGGIIAGGTAPSPDSADGGLVFGEDSNRVYIDITNLHSTEILYVNIGEQAVIGEGIAILPESSKQLWYTQGQIYVASESGDVQYSIFAGKG